MVVNFSLNDALIAMVLVLVMLASHYLCRALISALGLSARHFSSFAGGVAAAYVFLHMLPDLVESRDRIHILLDQMTIMTPFKDLAVFMIALTGFEVFYVLERYTVSSKLSERDNHHRHFMLNISLYCTYNFLITYTLIERIKIGTVYGILFTIAMSLHFVITDNRFNRYFPKLFNRRAQLILLGALLAGYLGSLVVPVNIYNFAILTAFLSGGVLYNTFSEELTLTRKTSMLFFFIGSTVMALLLSLLLIK